MSAFNFHSDELSITDALDSLAHGDPTPSVARTGGVGVGLMSVDVTDSNNRGEGLTTGRSEESESFEMIDVLFDGERSGLSGTPNNKFKVCIFPSSIIELQKICLGLIGHGPTFCIRKNCTTTHKGGTVQIDPSSMHVVKVSDTSVFLEPAVNSGTLSDTLRRAWVDERLTLDEWTERFAIVKNSPRLVTETSFAKAKDFAKQAKDFKTPIKTNVLLDPFDFGKDKVLDTEREGFVRPYKRKIQDVEVFISKKPMSGELSRIVASSEECLEQVSTSLLVTQQNVKVIGDKVNSELPVLFSRHENLETMIGTRAASGNSLLRQFEAPTLWSSLSALSGQVIEAHRLIKQHKPLDINETKAEILESVSYDMHASYGVELDTIRDRVGKLTTDIAISIRKIGERINRDAATVLTLQEAMNKLSSFPTMKTGTACAGGSTIFTKDVDTLAVQVIDLNEKVTKVEDKVNEMIANTTKDSIKFCKLGFRRPEDAFAWIDIHHPDYGFSLIVDVHMVFEHVFVQGGEGQGSIQRLQSLVKLNMTNLAQGTAISSFDSRNPKCLASPETFLKSQVDDSYFDKIKTHYEWSKPSQGFRDRFKNALALFSEAHKQRVAEHPLCRPGSPLYNTAATSRTLTTAWIESFFLFIDETYEELTVAKFSPAKGWSLITRLALCILQDVATPRNGVSESFFIGDNPMTCKRIFWAVIQCHDIMERYKSNLFKNDPAVSAEYVKFLVMNTGLDALDSITKQNTILKEKVEALSTQAKNAASHANSASNAVDKLSTKVEGLVQRINSLANNKKPANQQA